MKQIHDCPFDLLLVPVQAVFSAGIRAVFDLVPCILPFFAPLHFASTDDTHLGRPVHLSGSFKSCFIPTFKFKILPAIAIPLSAAPSSRDVWHQSIHNSILSPASQKEPVFKGLAAAALSQYRNRYLVDLIDPHPVLSLKASIVYTGQAIAQLRTRTQQAPSPGVGAQQR
ncbi:MAG: hypothetical protein PVG81_11755 [Desulfobacterales bacterium]|jgi:hypothetical protein